MTMKRPALIGGEIFLRSLDRQDAAIFVPWVNDPEVIRTLAIGTQTLDVRAEEVFIEKTNASAHNALFGIVLKATHQLIGSTGLDQIDFRNRRANFGIMIGEKSEWGKGYGTEATALVVQYAFVVLDLNRVQLFVYEYNPYASRAYEKVGFQSEGVLRQDHFYAGRHWDTIVMAIVRGEWERKMPSPEG